MNSQLPTTKVEGMKTPNINFSLNSTRRSGLSVNDVEFLSPKSAEIVNNNEETGQWPKTKVEGMRMPNVD